MLYVQKDGTIRLTRGDTAMLTVNITNSVGGDAYELSAGDVLTMTVKKSVNDTNCVFKKVVTGTNVFHVLPADTSSQKFGKYKYDVQLNTESGDVYTVVEPSTFEIMAEVTS